MQLLSYMYVLASWKISSRASQFELEMAREPRVSRAEPVFWARR
jgi:hypothetical protein